MNTVMARGFPQDGVSLKCVTCPVLCHCYCCCCCDTWSNYLSLEWSTLCSGILLHAKWEAYSVILRRCVKYWTYVVLNETGKNVSVGC